MAESSDISELSLEELGEVEQTLHYLISLASADDERSGTNAA